MPRVQIEVVDALIPTSTVSHIHFYAWGQGLWELSRQKSQCTLPLLLDTISTTVLRTIFLHHQIFPDGK